MFSNSDNLFLVALLRHLKVPSNYNFWATFSSLKKKNVFKTDIAIQWICDYILLEHIKYMYKI